MAKWYGTREFDDSVESAVNSFKSIFGSYEELYRFGQFYVTSIIMVGILETIEFELRNSLRLQALLSMEGASSEKYAAAVQSQLDRWMPYFRRQWDRAPDAIPVEVIVNDVIPNIEQQERQMFPGIRALFPLGKPTQADASEVQETFQRVWNRPGIPTARIWIRPTLTKAIAARALEKNKCFEVSRQMAKKILDHRKITTINPRLRIAVGTVPGVVVKEGQSGPPPLIRQQIIVYGNQATLKTTMALMQSALSASVLVQCGVLSGVRQDSNLFTQPEHYLLAFASCKIGGLDGFLCWDPDSGASNVETTTWGYGFTCLFYTAGRLSTAFDDFDLTAIERDPNKKREVGNHVATPRRHCYQVYYLQTLPL
jgi:hypothetical protein